MSEENVDLESASILDPVCEGIRALDIAISICEQAECEIACSENDSLFHIEQNLGRLVPLLVTATSKMRQLRSKVELLIEAKEDPEQLDNT